jgi:uncharacterized protein (TIGR00730 family)
MNPRKFRRICVFCGSNVGGHPAYAQAAASLGALLVRDNIGLVYGGGKIGLMGVIANEVMQRGGQVYGVIPERLKALEVGHDNLTELFVVDSMHARKAMMANLSDAFIAMPGGWGTLEELFEVTTWTQLNYHKKPIGVLNVNGYYDKLIDWADHAVDAGFIRAIHRPIIASDSDPEALLEKLRLAEIPELGRWIEKP